MMNGSSGKVWKCGRAMKSGRGFMDGGPDETGSDGEP